MLLKQTALTACLACSLSLAVAQETTDYDCLIEARQEVDVRSPVEGVIETMFVGRGEPVKRGKLIAKLSSGPELAALNLARSRATMEGEVKAAEARVDITKKKWERAEELHKMNFVSANAKDEAEAEFRLDRAIARGEGKPPARRARGQARRGVARAALDLQPGHRRGGRGLAAPRRAHQLEPERSDRQGHGSRPAQRRACTAAQSVWQDQSGAARTRDAGAAGRRRLQRRGGSR